MTAPLLLFRLQYDMRKTSFYTFTLQNTPKNVRDCSHRVIGGTCTDRLPFMALTSKDAFEILTAAFPVIPFGVMVVNHIEKKIARDIDKFQFRRGKWSRVVVG